MISVISKLLASILNSFVNLEEYDKNNTWINLIINAFFIDL